MRLEFRDFKRVSINVFNVPCNVLRNYLLNKTNYYGRFFMQFKDKVAIVTGGTRGIGKAIVWELAKNGCNVAFNYSKNAEAANALVKEIETLGVKGKSFQVDAVSFNGAKDMVKE